MKIDIVPGPDGAWELVTRAGYAGGLRTLLRSSDLSKPNGPELARDALRLAFNHGRRTEGALRKAALSALLQDDPLGLSL